MPKDYVHRKRRSFICWKCNRRLSDEEEAHDGICETCYQAHVNASGGRRDLPLTRMPEGDDSRSAD